MVVLGEILIVGGSAIVVASAIFWAWSSYRQKLLRGPDENSNHSPEVPTSRNSPADKSDKIMAGIGGHIVAFNNSSEATSQREFDPPAAVQIRNFHCLMTWLGQSPFNSAQSVRKQLHRIIAELPFYLFGIRMPFYSDMFAKFYYGIKPSVLRELGSTHNCIHVLRAVEW